MADKNKTEPRKQAQQKTEPEKQVQQSQAVIPFDQQMARRQSAPRPTPQSELQKMQMAQQMQGMMGAFKR